MPEHFCWTSFNHKLADDPRVVALRSELERAVQRLAELERSYDDEMASVHRKRAMQWRECLRAPAPAYSAFEEDAPALGRLCQQMFRADADAESSVPDRSLLVGIPVEQWMQWRAAPLRRWSNGALIVAMVNPFDGFTLAEIAKVWEPGSSRVAGPQKRLRFALAWTC